MDPRIKVVIGCIVFFIFIIVAYKGGALDDQCIRYYCE